MAMGGYDGSININTKIDSSGFNNGIAGISKGLDKITGSLKGLAAAVGLAFGIAAVVNFGKASVQASTELSNAMMGLQSILQGQGRNFQSAQDFINKYTSDGLIPATNAITAYKNLASRGYSDPQIQNTLQALKDSAAFGRQASYSLGDAVSTATEGLKNENSILVDNAGVTKNVAKMWEDYAKSIGVSANDLTKQQKIQAEYNGIMEETRFQTGDAAKLAGTYSGQVQQLGFNFNNLKVAVGNALIPIVSAVLPGLNAIITALTRVINLAAQVTTALFGRQTAQQQKAANATNQNANSANKAATAQNKLANATKKAGKAADGSLASFDQLNVLQKDTADTAANSPTSVETNGGSKGNEKDLGFSISPAVQAAVDAFKKLIAPLKAIDFTNLKNAFGVLVDAVKPLGKTLFSGLEWAYNNIFVPLAKWTIEDYLPAWCRESAAQIKVLNSVLDALKPLGIWLWDNFLRPLAQWTGGVIISVMDGITGALTNISDWIDNNQGLVQDIAIVIGSFAAAWLLVNGAIAIWNVIGVIAASVTGAFGAAVAFLTSPIGLVILAIAAIIAIVVLLIKHWDQVKAASAACWAWIVSVWNSAASWFNSNVIQPLVRFFSGLWTSIQGVFGGVGNWFRGVFQSAAEGIRWAFSSIGSFFRGIWNTIRDMFSSIGTTIGNGIGGAFKAVVNSIIDFAQNTINGFIRAINSAIGMINYIPGVHIGTISEMRIPRLATGAVIPPRAEFAAILGDQRSGTNIEAPESLIRNIVADEIGKINIQPQVVVKASGSDSALIRWVKFEIEKEDNRVGAKFATGGGRI